MHWLVIGFGNDLAGDDGFGIAVAEQIKKRAAYDLAMQITIKVIATRILAPELLEDINIADAVIFIDASAALTDGLPKKIDLQKSISSELECGSSIFLSHRCNPLTLMQLSQTLYNHNPPAWLYAIGSCHFGLFENLSDVVADLVPEVAAQIIDQINKHALCEQA